MRGGSGKTSAICGSTLFIALKCFIVIAQTFGKQGSKEVTKTGVFVDGVLPIKLMACFLGIFCALCIAEFIIPGL